MKELLKSVFDKEKIEYYAVLPYSECKEINRAIMERESFTPRSVIVYLVPYYSGEVENLSRYAASLDYHIALRSISESIISALTEALPGSRSRGYGDHSPINECNAALRASLGVAGDNGLIINEKYGSYVFIGDIVTDIPPEALGAIEPTEIKTCLHCGRCLRACPTGILGGEGTDCLSAITQRKGELSENEVELMRKFNTVWGCDVCQSVCPYNREPLLTPIDFFYKDRIPLLTREVLDSMTKEAFMLRAFAWRGRKTVERNLDLLACRK